MDNINNIAEQFKEYSQLADFTNKQSLALIESNKKNQELTEKVAHLEALLVGNTSLHVDNKKEQDRENAILVCIAHINMFKDRILTQQWLNTDDTKRFEIYVKILSNLKYNNKHEAKDHTELSNMSTEALLTLVNK